MKKIIITGFSHSGTSILKSIIGHIENVYEYPYEEHIITDEMIKEARRLNKKFILIKRPRIDLRGSYYDDFIKIFIIRDPYQVMSSINRRFQYELHKKHNFKSYEYFAKIYLETLDQNLNNFYHIKYEDMFDNNYQKLREIFDNIGFVYSSKIFRNEKFKNVISKDDIDNINHKPEYTEHTKYRTWQINQPFRNMNDKNRIELTKGQINAISNSTVVKKLEYRY